MKKYYFFLVLVVFLCCCLGETGIAYDQDRTPPVTLPIANLLEVRKELIRLEGDAHPDGWELYFQDYVHKTAHALKSPYAGPFQSVQATPYTLEMRWVEILAQQDHFDKRDCWAEQAYRDTTRTYSHILGFRIYIFSPSWLIGEAEHLRFVFQDSQGHQSHGEIVHAYYDESKTLIYMVEIEINVSLLSNPQDITWFCLQMFNPEYPGRVDMRWEFRKE